MEGLKPPRCPTSQYHFPSKEISFSSSDTCAHRGLLAQAAGRRMQSCRASGAGGGGFPSLTPRAHEQLNAVSGGPVGSQ